MSIDINRILNEARVIGCSDLHFTYGITPIVRLNGALRKMSKYPEMDEEGIMDIANQMTNEQQMASIRMHKDTDVSFISLTLVLPAVYRLLADVSECVALIKPQFEAGRANIGKKGIVRSEAVHQEVLEQIIAFARNIGFSVQGLCPSPIRGGEGNGNTEYLVYLVKGSDMEEPEFDLKTMIRQADING